MNIPIVDDKVVFSARDKVQYSADYTWSVCGWPESRKQTCQELIHGCTKHQEGSTTAAGLLASYGSYSGVLHTRGGGVVHSTTYTCQTHHDLSYTSQVYVWHTWSNVGMRPMTLSNFMCYNCQCLQFQVVKMTVDIFIMYFSFLS